MTTFDSVQQLLLEIARACGHIPRVKYLMTIIIIIIIITIKHDIPVKQPHS